MIMKIRILKITIKMSQDLVSNENSALDIYRTRL